MRTGGIAISALQNSTVAMNLTKITHLDGAWSAKVASDCMAMLVGLRQLMITHSPSHERPGMPVAICLIIVFFLILLMACRETRLEHGAMERMAVQNHCFPNVAMSGAFQYDFQRLGHLPHGDRDPHHRHKHLHHHIPDHAPWHALGCTYP